MNFTILSTGYSLPENVVSNDDLAKLVNTSDEWIKTRTGIETRRVAKSGDGTSALASRAAKQALLAAGLDAKDISLIVVATVSNEYYMPSCACLVQKNIGASQAFAFDVNAACSGFLYGLNVVEKYIQASPEMKVLLIGAETMSSRVNWQDRNTCILFGDGAGAVVCTGQGDGEVLATDLASDGSLYELLFVEGAASCNKDIALDGYDGSYVKMAGRDVFRHAVLAMERSVISVLTQAVVDISEVKLVIPHQANIRILNKLKDKLGLADEKVYINVNKYGNTSAASIPIALHEANQEGLLVKGDLVLFCAFGGGFTWGATLIRW